MRRRLPSNSRYKRAREPIASQDFSGRATDLEETATITCLDGIGAFDHISRAAFLSKLQEVVPSLVPFVLQFYGRNSTYYWWDDRGTRHTILQGEGCEQGNPLCLA